MLIPLNAKSMLKAKLVYLDIAEIDIVILKEAYEFLEIFFGWEVMTTVWPYSL